MPADYPTSFTTDSGSLECQSSRYGHHDAVGGSYKLFLHFFPHRRNYSSVSGGIRSNSTLSSGQCTESFGRRVHLKRSKCDQFGNRVDVFTAPSGVAFNPAVHLACGDVAMYRILQSSRSLEAIKMREWSRCVHRSYWE